MGDPNINASCRYRGGNKNRVSDGKLRKSQLLTSFGVGAIVEINDQSLMGMDISRWSPSITKNKKYRISPIPRLEKMLKKSFFISCNPKVITHCEYKVQKLLSEKDEFESHLKYNK